MRKIISVFLVVIFLSTFPTEGIASASVMRGRTMIALATRVDARLAARKIKLLSSVVTRTPVRKGSVSKPSIRPRVLLRKTASLSSIRPTTPFLVTPSSSKPVTVPSTPTPAVMPGQLRDQIVALTNAERAKVGLAPVQSNALLQNSAQLHAQDMARRVFFSHQNPDGLRSFDRIKAGGYVRPPCDCSWNYWTGENIARGQKTVDEVMEDWMHSPTHREDILSPNFDEIGIGLSGAHWVQNFGKIDP